MFKDEIYDIREQKIAHAVTSMIEQHTTITGFYYRQVVFYPERRNYYSKNLSIINVSSYSDWNMFWDAKILRIREIMMLFKL